MNVLGLDASSSTIGWGVLNEKMELLNYGYIKPKGSKYPLEERLDDAVKKVKEVYDKHNPDVVVIEEILKRAPGKTGINTILILAAFNTVLGYEVYKRSGKIPERMMPATIRKYIRIFVQKNSGRLSKNDAFYEVRRYFSNYKPFLIERNGPYKGNERKENLDVCDGVCCAWAYLIKTKGEKNVSTK